MRSQASNSVFIDVLGERVAAALRDADFDAARTAAVEARDLAATPRDMVRAKLWRVQSDYIADPESAVRLALEALADVAMLEDLVLEARLLSVLSRILLATGESQEALEHAMSAVRLIDSADPSEADDLLRARMMAESALGNAHLGLQDTSSALDCCRRAVECARELSDQIALGAALDTVACVEAAISERERDNGNVAAFEHWQREALRHSAQAVRIAREQGHRANEATALNNLVESMTLLGETDQALGLLDEWAKRYPDSLPHVQAHHLDTRGTVCLALGRADEARSWFEKSLGCSTSPPFQLVVTQHLAEAFEQCGDWEAALATYKRFHMLHVHLSAERAQRSARVAAVRLGAERSRMRADFLTRSNEQLQRRAEDLLRLSSEDPLTGLANRRRLEELMALEPNGYCVLLLDIDHFKRVNDDYSHAIGDEVLRCVADLMRQGCRGSDTACRLGGEEFVALLRVSVPGAAADAAERLRLLVANHDWGKVATGLAITVSIGTADADEADRGDDLVALADRRLYIAKNGGRNLVVSTG